MRRKRSFLSDRAWKTIPFQRCGKSPKQHLLDIMADVPWLLEVGDYLAGDPFSTDAFAKFLLLYRYIDRALVAWHDGESPPLSTRELDELGAKTTGITDMDIYIGELMCQYWTSCVLVYSMFAMTLSRCSAHFDVGPYVSRYAADMETAPRTDSKDPRGYITRITRMLGLFLQPEAGEMAIKPAALPLGVCLSYLRATGEMDSADAVMMKELFVKNERGRTLGKFIDGTLVEWSYPGEKKKG